MKPISETLRNLANMPARDETVRFFFVVDDPKADEPMVSQFESTESRLARTGAHKMAKDITRRLIVSGLMKWRENSNE